jgi:hypothetical protein
MCVPTKDLGYARNAPWRVTLPEDVVRQEVNCVYIEGTDAGPIHLDAHTSTAWVVARAQGEETPSEPKTSGGGGAGGDDEEEDEDGDEGIDSTSPFSTARGPSLAW